MESGGTFLKTNTGYPSGTRALMAAWRAARPAMPAPEEPTAIPQTTIRMQAAAAAANGGAGGFGGDSWNTNLSVGGEGGTVFPATINRVAMGGGGGAGTRNNSDGDTQASGGAAGGGIIIIRTYGLSGTGTLTANGASAYNVTANDAGGGGGAGGTLLFSPPTVAKAVSRCRPTAATAAMPGRSSPTASPIVTAPAAVVAAV